MWRSLEAIIMKIFLISLHLSWVKSSHNLHSKLEMIFLWHSRLFKMLKIYFCNPFSFWPISLFFLRTLTWNLYRNWKLWHVCFRYLKGSFLLSFFMFIMAWIDYYRELAQWNALNHLSVEIYCTRTSSIVHLAFVNDKSCSSSCHYYTLVLVNVIFAQMSGCVCVFWEREGWKVIIWLWSS